MITMWTLLTPVMNNFINFCLLPLNMLEEEKTSLLISIDILITLLGVFIQGRYWEIKMAICLEKLIKNIPSHNPSKRDQRLELEEICMLSLLLILMSMAVVATFLLGTKESLFRKISVERLTDLKDIDTSSQL